MNLENLKNHEELRETVEETIKSLLDYTEGYKKNIIIFQDGTIQTTGLMSNNSSVETEEKHYLLCSVKSWKLDLDGYEEKDVDEFAIDAETDVQVEALLSEYMDEVEENLNDLDYVYETESGQSIRQWASQGKTTFEYKELINDWCKQCGCSGGDGFTDRMWSTDIENLERWANEWADGYMEEEEEITFTKAE